MTRSYYTTPLFVIVTLIGLFTYAQANRHIYNLENINTQIYEEYINRSEVNTQALKKIRSDEMSQNHIETPDAVRSIYVSSWVAATPSLLNNLIEFVGDSEINSVIIDIKDSTGNISFAIDNESINQYNKTQARIQNIESLIEALHEKDIYVIGRLTTFQDPELAKLKPELAFKRLDTGEVWKDKKGLAFINPNKKEAWEYLVALAKISYEVGFDEINFDYIRYPSDGNISNIDYDLNDNYTRGDHLKEFYQYLDSELRSNGIPISADIFGLVTTAKDDLGIGQVFEDIFPHFDAIAPMVYPSHYSSGFFGYSNPNARPYEVVYAAMESAKNRAVAIDDDPQKLRTWIQDFSLYGVTYGEKEVRDQIRATYDLGLDSYMVWDPKNKYTKDAYNNNL